MLWKSHIHVWYITISVGKKNAVGRFFVYKVNIFSLKVTKSVSDLVSPVSGTVVAVNEAVVDEPGTINEDPYGAGWLFTVTVSAEGDLLSAQDYADKFDAVVDG